MTTESSSMQAGSIVTSACSSTAGDLQQEFVRQKQHDHMCHGKKMYIGTCHPSIIGLIIIKMGTQTPIHGKITSLFVKKKACFDHGTHGGEPPKRLGNPIARCVCVRVRMFRVSSFYQALRSQAESQWQTEEPQQGILARTTKMVYKIGYF